MAERVEWVDLSPANVRKSLESYGASVLGSLCLGRYAADVHSIVNDVTRDYDMIYYNNKTYVSSGLKKFEDAINELRAKVSEYKTRVYERVRSDARRWIEAHTVAVETMIRQAVLSVPGFDKALSADPGLSDRIVSAAVSKAVSAGSLCEAKNWAIEQAKSAVASYLRAHPGASIAMAIESGVPVETFTAVPAGVTPQQMLNLVQQAVNQAVAGIQMNITPALLQAYLTLQPVLNQIANNMAAYTVNVLQQQQYLQQQVQLQQQLQQEYEAIRKQLEEQAKVLGSTTTVLDQGLGVLNSTLQYLAQASAQGRTLTNRELANIAQQLASSKQKAFHAWLMDMILKVDWEKWGKMLEMSPDPVRPTIRTVNRDSIKTAGRPTEWLPPDSQIDPNPALDGIQALLGKVVDYITLGQLRPEAKAGAEEIVKQYVEAGYQQRHLDAIGRAGGYFLLVNLGNLTALALHTLVKAASLGTIDTVMEIWRNIIWSTGLPWMSWAISGAKIRAALLNDLEAYENYIFQSRYPTVSEIKDMLATGWIDKDRARLFLRFQGLPDWHIEFELLDAYKSLSETQIKDLLLSGAIDVEEAFHRLKKLRHSDRDAVLIMSSWLEEKKEKLRKEILERVEKRYKAGALTREEAIAMATDVLGDENMARTYVSLWDVDLATVHEKNLSESWIEKLWRAKKLTDDQALMRLVKIGYSPDDANLILSYWREHKK